MQATPFDAAPLLPATAPRKHHGYRVVAVLLSLSFVGSLFMLRGYHETRTKLAAALNEVRAAGAGLDIEGCVDHTLAFERACPLSNLLCEKSVNEYVYTCLAAADRRTYCEAQGERTMTGGFGYQECAARNLPRQENKVCGIAYAEIANHCYGLARQAPAPLPAPAPVEAGRATKETTP